MAEIAAKIKEQKRQEEEKEKKRQEKDQRKRQQLLEKPELPPTENWYDEFMIIWCTGVEITPKILIVNNITNKSQMLFIPL